jgi:hypothetical protein
MNSYSWVTQARASLVKAVRLEEDLANKEYLSNMIELLDRWLVDYGEPWGI